MKRYRSMVAVLVISAIGVGGCARATAAKDPGPGKAVAPDSPFCKQFLTYRNSTIGLNGLLLAADPQRAAQTATSAAQQLSSMKSAVTDNQAIQADLQTVSDAFAAVAKAVASVPPNNRRAYLAAVNAGIATVGALRTSTASANLDAYTTTQCGLTTSPNLPTTTTGVTPLATTLVPSGPTVPSTTTTR
jgi:hypothetical protein